MESASSCGFTELLNFTTLMETTSIVKHSPMTEMVLEASRVATAKMLDHCMGIKASP